MIYFALVIYVVIGVLLYKWLMEAFDTKAERFALFISLVFWPVTVPMACLIVAWERYERRQSHVKRSR